MKTLFANYFMSLVNFVLAIVKPSDCDYDTEKYFAMSRKELAMVMIPHVAILSGSFMLITVMNMFAIPQSVAFVVLLPVIMTVIFTIADSVAIGQAILTDMTGKPEEYVDPETGETRTLMTYKKIRIF